MAKKQPEFITYLHRLVICVLFFGQIMTETLPYCYVMFNAETEIIELTNLEEKEGEEEDKKENQKENKKKKEDRQNIAFLFNLDKSHMLNEIIHQSDIIASLFHPEILTPPPEPIFRNHYSIT